MSPLSENTACCRARRPIAARLSMHQSKSASLFDRVAYTRNIFWSTISHQSAAVTDFLRAVDLATLQHLMSTSPCLAAT